jgi:hypothetical protein
MLDRGLANSQLQQIRAQRVLENATKGKAFEKQTGTDGARQRIEYPNGRSGFPDKLTSNTIEEAKSGFYQSLTQQLRGQQDYARMFGLEHVLHMPANSTVSAPLKTLINSGDITLKLWP